MKTAYEIEYDMNQIFEKVVREYDLNNEYYGDHYPDEIRDIQKKAQMDMSEKEYDRLLWEAEEIARRCAESYIKWKSNEEDGEGE